MATRLNSITRESIVDEIMKGTNFASRIEAAQKAFILFVNATMYAALPPEIKAIFKDAADFNDRWQNLFNGWDERVSLLKRLADKLPPDREHHCTELQFRVPYIAAFGSSYTTIPFDSEIVSSQEGFEYCLARAERQAMKRRIKAVVAATSTVENLIRQYPEWEPILNKYILPKQGGKNAYPVVDANLATDLMKAGWPDGGKPKQAAPALIASAESVVDQVAA